MCVFKYKQKDKNYLGYLKQFLKNFIFINLCDYFVFYKKNLKFSTQPFFLNQKFQNRHQDPFFHNWHLEISPTSRRVFVLQTDRSESTAGLTDLSICCSGFRNGRTISVDGFQGSIEVPRNNLR